MGPPRAIPAARAPRVPAGFATVHGPGRREEFPGSPVCALGRVSAAVPGVGHGDARRDHLPGTYRRRDFQESRNGSTRPTPERTAAASGRTSGQRTPGACRADRIAWTTIAGLGAQPLLLGHCETEHDPGHGCDAAPGADGPGDLHDRDHARHTISPGNHSPPRTARISPEVYLFRVTVSPLKKCTHHASLCATYVLDDQYHWPHDWNTGSLHGFNRP